MKKFKQSFLCEECGTEHLKWAGRCSRCSSWNTIVEYSERFESEVKTNVKRLSEIEECAIKAYGLSDPSLNEIFGGGLRGGSSVLLSGEPGVGKTTFSLELASKFANTHRLPTLFISGEEALAQLSERCHRTEITSDYLYLLEESNLEKALSQAKLLDPKLIIIDSIQTLYSNLLESRPNSLSQVREVCRELIDYAREMNSISIILAHVNKNSRIAGPKTIEHMVDVVMELKRETGCDQLKLSSSKNRYSSIHRSIGYLMKSNGLNEVSLDKVL